MILVFQASLHTICIADINIYKRSLIRGIIRFSPEAVGALGGMLGDGVLSH